MFQHVTNKTPASHQLVSKKRPAGQQHAFHKVYARAPTSVQEIFNKCKDHQTNLQKCPVLFCPLCCPCPVLSSLFLSCSLYLVLSCPNAKSKLKPKTGRAIRKFRRHHKKQTNQKTTKIMTPPKTSKICKIN